MSGRFKEPLGALIAALAAWDAGDNQHCPSLTALAAACRAYHRHMMEAMQAEELAAQLLALADTMPDQPDLADRLRALAARERGVS